MDPLSSLGSLSTDIDNLIGEQPFLDVSHNHASSTNPAHDSIFFGALKARISNPVMDGGGDGLWVMGEDSEDGGRAEMPNYGGMLETELGVVLN